MRVVFNEKYRHFSGKADGLIFYTRKGTNCARREYIPRNPRTQVQQANRHKLAAASRSWKELPDKVKRYYNIKAYKYRKSVSGYNLYVGDYIKGETDFILTSCNAGNISIIPLSDRHNKGLLRINSEQCKNRHPKWLKSGRDRPEQEIRAAKAG